MCAELYKPLDYSHCVNTTYDERKRLGKQGKLALWLTCLGCDNGNFIYLINYGVDMSFLAKLVVPQRNITVVGILRLTQLWYIKTCSLLQLEVFFLNTQFEEIT